MGDNDPKILRKITFSFNVQSFVSGNTTKIAKKNITLIIAKFVVVAYYYITKDMVRSTICASIATHTHLVNKPYLTKPSSMGRETL